MCALFGPGVTVHREPLALAGGGVVTGALDVEATVRLVPLVTATSRSALPAVDAPAVHAAELGTATPVVLPGPELAVTRGAIATRDLGGNPFLLATTVHTVAADPPPRVHTDLAFMRGRPLVRRGIPASRLPEEQQAYWIKRLSDARRVNARLVRLVLVFPDLPLEAERPVSYRSEEEAIVYSLPDQPVPLSTLVIARHATTGEPIQGRFYRDAPF